MRKNGPVVRVSAFMSSLVGVTVLGHGCACGFKKGVRSFDLKRTERGHCPRAARTVARTDSWVLVRVC